MQIVEKYEKRKGLGAVYKPNIYLGFFSVKSSHLSGMSSLSSASSSIIYKISSKISTEKNEMKSSVFSSCL